MPSSDHSIETQGRTELFSPAILSNGEELLIINQGHNQYNFPETIASDLKTSLAKAVILENIPPQGPNLPTVNILPDAKSQIAMAQQNGIPTIFTDFTGGYATDKYKLSVLRQEHDKDVQLAEEKYSSAIETILMTGGIFALATAALSFKQSLTQEFTRRRFLGGAAKAATMVGLISAGLLAADSLQDFGRKFFLNSKGEMDSNTSNFLQTFFYNTPINAVDGDSYKIVMRLRNDKFLLTALAVSEIDTTLKNKVAIIAGAAHDKELRERAKLPPETLASSIGKITKDVLLPTFYSLMDSALSTKQEGKRIKQMAADLVTLSIASEQKKSFERHLLLSPIIVEISQVISSDTSLHQEYLTQIELIKTTSHFSWQPKSGKT